MSHWPDRYALYNYRYSNIDDVQIDVDPDGDYVKYADFEKILNFCAGIISTRPPFDTMHPQAVAKWVLDEYEKDKTMSNEDPPKALTKPELLERVLAAINTIREQGGKAPNYDPRNDPAIKWYYEMKAKGESNG